MKKSKAIFATAIIIAMLIVIIVCMFKLSPVLFKIMTGFLACVGLFHGSKDLACFFTADLSPQEEESLAPVPVVMGEEVPSEIPQTVDEIMREVRNGIA